MNEEAGGHIAFRPDDPEAFVDVVVHYQVTLLRTAYSILGDASIAEEVVADAFLALHRHASEMREGESVLPWLIRVVVNRSITVARKRSRERLMARVLWSAPKHEIDPEEEAVAGELRALVTREVHKLPEAERAVLVLHYFLDQDLETMAATLGCSTGSIKARLFRARTRLRGRLQASTSSMAVVSGEA